MDDDGSRDPDDNCVLTVSMFLFTWGNMEELLSFSCIFEMFEWVQNLIRAIGTMRKRDRCGIITIHNIMYSCANRVV